jgi:hypothetical protein
MSIYNLNETPSKGSSAPHYFSSRGKKRLIESQTLDSSPYSLSRHHQQPREDPSWSYQMDPCLVDRYGVETELACVAMNANGTSILGGSVDGDLFVWRGI